MKTNMKVKQVDMRGTPRTGGRQCYVWPRLGLVMGLVQHGLQRGRHIVVRHHAVGQDHHPGLAPWSPATHVTALDLLTQPFNLTSSTRLQLHSSEKKDS